MSSRPPRLLVIVGPTGAGKSDLAIDIARKIGGEVLSADSQQVYRGMDIGTGKVSAEDRARTPHHLIDVVDPDDEMTAARFLELADRAIANVAERGVPVIVAGGTMLYVRVLLRGIFPGPPADAAVRDRLEAEAATGGGTAALWQRLESVDPTSAARIDPADLRRIVRALEVFELTGEPLSAHHARHDFRSIPLRYPAHLVGLAPERGMLYERIDRRVEAMIAAGLVDEVERLRRAGLGLDHRSQRAIGYAEVHAHLDSGGDRANLDSVVRLIQRNSRRYARRQLSWYRRDDTVTWFPAAGAIDPGQIERYLRRTGSN